MLDRIRIVLCETSHPGNIGAAARAMRTMGLSRLTLVNPKQFPSSEARARASGAVGVLDKAQVVADLDEALAGVHFAVGTSARIRRIPLPIHEPRELPPVLAEQAVHGDVAVVFGRERWGLSNEEIDRCQALLNIPSDPSFSSLNLAAAVQVVCYELRIAGLLPAAEAPETDEALPDVPTMESFFGHLEQALLDIRFLVPEQSSSMLKRLRRLVHRAAPTLTELDILRGILSRAQKAAKDAGRDG